MNQVNSGRGYFKTAFIVVAPILILCLAVYIASTFELFSPPVSPIPAEYDKLLGVETVLWDNSIKKDIHFADPNDLCKKMFHVTSANGVSMWTASPQLNVKKDDRVETFKNLDMDFLTIYKSPKNKYLLPIVRKPINDIGWRFNIHEHHYEISSTLSDNQMNLAKLEDATLWIPAEDFEGEIVFLVQSHPMNSGWRLLTISKNDLPDLLKNGVKDIFKLEKLEDSLDKDVLLHLMELSKQYPFSQK